jgi:hypothetical protein
MVTAGRTVQTVSMPIVHNDMPAGVKAETVTAIEPTKLVMVIAVGTSAPAKLAHIRAVVSPIYTPIGAIVLAVALAISLTKSPAIGLAIALAITLAVGLAIALAIALAVGLAIALAITLAVGLPINLTVDLAFDPVSAIETAASRLGDRGRSADQSYGQRRSDDLAHPHCLSPLFAASTVETASTPHRRWLENRGRLLNPF